MADPIRITVDYSSSGELVIKQALANLDGLRERVERLSAAGPLSSKAMRIIGEDAERVANAYHGKLASAFGIVRNESNHLFDSIDRLGHRAFYGLLGITAAASAGLYGLGNAFLKVNEDFAGLEITVKSSLQSTQAARRIRDEVAAITADSPLPFKDLGESTRNLVTMPYSRGKIADQIATGTLSSKDGFFRQITTMVEQMVAFRPDKEAKDAIYSIREALSGQFRSLIRRFDIPSTALSLTSGKSLKELTNSPDETFKAMKQFFNSIITPEAINELVRQPKLLFQNAIEQVFHVPLLKIGDHSYRAVVDQLVVLYDRITSFTKAKFDGMAVKIGQSVKSLFTTVSQAGSKTAEFFMEEAGYGEKQLLGKTVFERGAAMITDGVGKFAKELPALLDKGIKFFEKIRPLLESLWAIVSTLGKAFLAFADFSPMLAALTLFFRRSLLDAATGVAEHFGQRLFSAVTAAHVTARAKAAAPDFSSINPLAVRAAGFAAPGGRSGLSPSEARAALADALYVPPGHINKLLTGTPATATAPAVPPLSQAYLQGVAAGAGASAKVGPKTIGAVLDPASVSAASNPQAAAMRQLVQNSAGNWTVRRGTSSALISELETVLSMASGSIVPGRILPDQGKVSMTVSGFKDSLAEVVGELNARLDADREANRQMSRAVQARHDAEARAAAPRPSLFSRAGVADRWSSVKASASALKGGIAATVSATAPGVLSFVGPMVALAAFTFAIQKATSYLEYKNNLETKENISRNRRDDEASGGITTRGYALNVVRTNAEVAERMLANENRSRENTSLPRAEFPEAEVVQLKDFARKVSSGGKIWEAAKAVGKLTPWFGDENDLDRLSGAGVDYTPVPKIKKMGTLQARHYAEQVVADHQRVSAWMEEKVEERRTLNLASLDVVLYPNSSTDFAMLVKETLRENEKAILTASHRSLMKVREAVSAASQEDSTAPLSEKWSQLDAEISSRIKSKFGSDFEGFFTEVRDERGKITRQGSLGSLNELRNRFVHTLNESLVEAYDAFEKNVEQANNPFKVGLDSTGKAVEAWAKNADTFEKGVRLLALRSAELLEGRKRAEAAYQDIVKEVTDNGEYQYTPQGKARLKEAAEALKARLAETTPGTLKEKLTTERTVKDAGVLSDALRSFSLEIGEAEKSRRVFLPEDKAVFEQGIEKMLNNLNAGLKVKLEVPALVKAFSASVPQVAFGEEKQVVENEATQAFSSAVNLTVAELRKRIPEVLGKDLLGGLSALANSTRLTAQRSQLSLAEEEKYRQEVQAREQLPQFFRRLPDLAPGVEGTHAIAELKTALASLEWTSLLDGVSDLAVFLKDASGPDHLSVMADKYKEMNRVLPVVIAKLEEETQLQRSRGLLETSKKTEASARSLSASLEQATSRMLEYFTSGLDRELSQVSKGLDDNFLRDSFPRQLSLLGEKLPGADFSRLTGLLSGSLYDQTLPAEQLQQAKELATNFRSQLATGLMQIAQESVNSLTAALALRSTQGALSPEYLQETAALKKTLDEASRALSALQGAALASQNDLQRDFITRQRQYADQALKTAQGSILSSLDASLTVRPSQSGRFQLADLERSVRDAGLEGQVPLKDFLKDSTGPENLAVLLEKQKSFEEAFLKLAESFDQMAKAAEAAAKPVIPDGFLDGGDGYAYNYEKGLQIELRPDMSRALELQSQSRSFSGRAESLRREQEEVRGTGMTDSFSRGFRGVTERFREEAQNFKSIGADIAQSLQTNLGGAFADFVTGTKTAKEAFADFGKSILNEVARIFANKAAAQLIGFAASAAFSLFAPAASGAVIDGGDGQIYNYGAGTLTTKAAGGPIVGGSGVRDDVPALLMGGEYVVRRTAVERYGEDFLHALNQSRLQIEPDGSNAGFAASVQQKPIADSVMPRRLLSEALDSELTKRAAGGMIFGGSGIRDDVPAMLMGGEFVVRRSAVERYGQDFMEALNTGAVIHRAEGGMVPRASGAPAWVAGPDAVRAEPVHVPAPVSHVDASSGDSLVNITINENGTVSEEHKGQKQGQFGDNKEFGRMLKVAVLEVMNNQRRPGGSWRNV